MRKTSFTLLGQVVYPIVPAVIIILESFHQYEYDDVLILINFCCLFFMQIASSYYLVSVVDNDYIHSSLFKVLRA